MPTRINETEQEQAFPDPLNPASYTASVPTTVAPGSAHPETALMPNLSYTPIARRGGLPKPYLPILMPQRIPQSYVGYGPYRTANQHISAGTMGYPPEGWTNYPPQNVTLGGYPAQSVIRNHSIDGRQPETVNSFNVNSYAVPHDHHSHPSSAFEAYSTHPTAQQMHPEDFNPSMWQSSMDQYSAPAPPSRTSGYNSQQNSSSGPNFPQ